MKKIKVVQIIGIMLVLLYVALVLTNLIWGVIDHSAFLFSIVIVLVGANLIYKGKLLKSASTLWFAFNLIFGAILIIILELLKLEIQDFGYIFAFVPMLASMFILVILRTKIYIKVMIINISVIIPLLVYKFAQIEWYFALIIAIICIVASIVICRNINLDKEKIDGKI